jgi:hypothetical protein
MLLPLGFAVKIVSTYVFEIFHSVAPPALEASLQVIAKAAASAVDTLESILPCSSPLEFVAKVVVPSVSITVDLVPAYFVAPEVA